MSDFPTLPTFASTLISLKNNLQYYSSSFQQFNTEINLKDPITILPFKKEHIEEEGKGLIVMKRVWIPLVALVPHQYDEIFELLRGLPFASEPLLWPFFPSALSTSLFPSSPSVLSLAFLLLFSVQNPYLSM